MFAVILSSVLLFILCLVFFCCIVFKSALDSINCGPGALLASLEAIKTVPTNAEVGAPSAVEKIKVAFSGDGLPFRIKVQLCCTCFFFAIFSFFGFLVIAFSTGLFDGPPINGTLNKTDSMGEQ